MPALPSSTRVLVIDNDPRVRSDLDSMLTILGYRTLVVAGAGADLIAQARCLAPKFRPHVAIVDLRLLDDYASGDRSGLELLDCLQSARCILYSAYLDPALTREARQIDETCTWISKSESPQRLIDAIQEASCQICAREGNLEIDKPDGWTSRDIVNTLFEGQEDITPDLVDDLLCQLLPSTRKVTLRNLGSEILTPGSVGRGRSVVMKTWRDNRREPLVLKLAPASDTLREWENYELYIRQNLGGLHYAHLEAPPVTFWDLGGMLYSFVGTSSHSLPSFAQFYREQKDPEAIVHPMKHFFREVWGAYYQEAAQERYPLFDSYNDILHLDRRLADWRDSDYMSGVVGLPEAFLDPISWVWEHSQESAHPDTRKAITHGDVHGDNLFVDSDYMWAIDFERSGPGPILRDFIELEVDIVTRLLSLPQNDPCAFLDLVVEWLAPTDAQAPLWQEKHVDAPSEANKARIAIETLRGLAHDLTGHSDNLEYFWGLLLDALFVASLTTRDNSQHNRALLLAVALVERLERWEDLWPPSDWRHAAHRA